MKALMCIFFTVMLTLVAGRIWRPLETRRPQGDPCGNGCTGEYSPVCITLQRTMSNKCEADNEICRLRAEGLTVKKQSPGACQCRRACSRDYKPVCGLNVNTRHTQLFSNACLLDLDICQGNPRKVVSLGQCQKQPGKSRGY